MLQAHSLSKLPGIRHAFFTRAGGVSDGVYESLNGGVGSERFARQGRRESRPHGEHLGVAPDRLLTCYQIHSPEVVVAETPWPRARGRAPTPS